MSTYTSKGEPISKLVGKVDAASYAFSISTNDLFTALDEGRPVEPSSMCPPIRESIANMRAVLDEAETALDAIEK